MNLKKKLLIILASIALLILVVLSVLLIKGNQLQTVHYQGYSVSVPASWSVQDSDDVLNFSEEDTAIGSFRLLYDECAPEDVPALLGYQAEDVSVRESDQYATKVYELRFTQNEQDVVIYVFNGLPNFPPYSAVYELVDVSGRTAKRMLSGFGLPNLGTKPPEKPIAEITDEFLEQAVYVVKRDTTVYANHLSILDRLIQAGSEQPADSASVLHILSFDANENGKTVSAWYYLSVGAGEKWLYSYHQNQAGQYYYKNDPKLIRDITREVSAEENYTRYFVDGQLILEAPYNPYAENKEALLAYKDTLISDNSGVSALIEKALPNGVKVEGISLEAQEKPFKILVRYAVESPDIYVVDGKLDEKVFYQNALVLFSLIQNVDVISMEIRLGETVQTLSYDREIAQQQFDNKDLHSFTTDKKLFESFTENVPKMSPPSEKGSGNGVDGTRVLHTTTVTVTPSMKVRHPKSGKMVSVQPYAERFGVTQYFNKPITIRLHEKTDAGNVTMWASATCGGSEIGTYPIQSKSEYFSLLGMLQ